MDGGGAIARRFPCAVDNQAADNELDTTAHNKPSLRMIAAWVRTMSAYGTADFDPPCHACVSVVEAVGEDMIRNELVDDSILRVGHIQIAVFVFAEAGIGSVAVGIVAPRRV